MAFKKIAHNILRATQRENGVPYDQVMENELVESNGWVPEYQAFNSVYGILYTHRPKIDHQFHWVVLSERLDISLAEKFFHTLCVSIKILFTTLSHVRSKQLRWDYRWKWRW